MPVTGLGESEARVKEDMGGPGESLQLPPKVASVFFMLSPTPSTSHQNFCPTGRHPTSSPLTSSMWPWHPFGPDREAEIQGSEAALLIHAETHFEELRLYPLSWRRATNDKDLLAPEERNGPALSTFA